MALKFRVEAVAVGAGGFDLYWGPSARIRSFIAEILA